MFNIASSPCRVPFFAADLVDNLASGKGAMLDGAVVGLLIFNFYSASTYRDVAYGAMHLLSNPTPHEAQRLLDSTIRTAQADPSYLHPTHSAQIALRQFAQT
jgi:hypothetical protein